MSESENENADGERSMSPPICSEEAGAGDTLPEGPPAEDTTTDIGDEFDPDDIVDNMATEDLRDLAKRILRIAKENNDDRILSEVHFKLNKRSLRQKYTANDGDETATPPDSANRATSTSSVLDPSHPDSILSLPPLLRNSRSHDSDKTDAAKPVSRRQSTETTTDKLRVPMSPTVRTSNKQRRSLEIPKTAIPIESLSESNESKESKAGIQGMGKRQLVILCNRKPATAKECNDQDLAMRLCKHMAIIPCVIVSALSAENSTTTQEEQLLVDSMQLKPSGDELDDAPTNNAPTYTYPQFFVRNILHDKNIDESNAMIEYKGDYDTMEKLYRTGMFSVESLEASTPTGGTDLTENPTSGSQNDKSMLGFFLDEASRPAGIEHRSASVGEPSLPSPRHKLSEIKTPQPSALSPRPTQDGLSSSPPRSRSRSPDINVSGNNSSGSTANNSSSYRSSSMSLHLSNLSSSDSLQYASQNGDNSYSQFDGMNQPKMNRSTDSSEQFGEMSLGDDLRMIFDMENEVLPVRTPEDTKEVPARTSTSLAAVPTITEDDEDEDDEEESDAAPARVPMGLTTVPTITEEEEEEEEQEGEEEVEVEVSPVDQKAVSEEKEVTDEIEDESTDQKTSIEGKEEADEIEGEPEDQKISIEGKEEADEIEDKPENQKISSDEKEEADEVEDEPEVPKISSKEKEEADEVEEEPEDQNTSIEEKEEADEIEIEPEDQKISSEEEEEEEEADQAQDQPEDQKVSGEEEEKEVDQAQDEPENQKTGIEEEEGAEIDEVEKESEDQKPSIKKVEEDEEEEDKIEDEPLDQTTGSVSMTVLPSGVIVKRETVMLKGRKKAEPPGAVSSDNNSSHYLDHVKGSLKTPSSPVKVPFKPIEPKPKKIMNPYYALSYYSGGKGGDDSQGSETNLPEAESPVPAPAHDPVVKSVDLSGEDGEPADMPAQEDEEPAEIPSAPAPAPAPDPVLDSVDQPGEDRELADMPTQEDEEPAEIPAAQKYKEVSQREYLPWEKKFIGTGACYLVFHREDDELNIHYSEKPMANALGAWTSVDIANFKETQGLSDCELIGTCASNVTQDKKHFCQGWVQFVKAAKIMDATVTAVDGVGLPVEFYLYDQGRTIQVFSSDGEAVFDTKVADAIACVPKGCEFSATGIVGKKWGKIAKKLGAVALFKSLSVKKSKEIDGENLITRSSNTSNVVREISVPISDPRDESMSTLNTVSPVAGKPKSLSTIINWDQDVPLPAMNAPIIAGSSSELPCPDGGACYLVYDPDSSGQLVEHYSKTPVAFSIGRWTPGSTKKIAGFKFKRNLGRNVLIRNCSGGVQGRKNFYSGWCQFVRSAKNMQGEVILWDTAEGRKGLKVDVCLYYDDNRPNYQTVRMKEGTAYTTDNILAVACLPKDTPFFDNMTADLLLWLAEGSKHGYSSKM